ncbi:GntR family transcriptional regulator [Yoonia sp. R2331]|uniref:GntR family transcriptional regulator n=1 Tax=Yoonia sp. R2331 TaxID=3237238 RepID=UPI0034E37EC5
MTSKAHRISQLERAYETLRDAIISCEIAPEAKIRIAEMCDIYGFSAGSVREALSRLTADGLVVAEPQKGFRAAPISAKDLRELTASRTYIEALCVRMAIEFAGVEWEGQVLAAHHALSRLPMLIDGEDKISADWTRKHYDFHDALAKGCDNSWMLRMRRMLYEQSERYRQISVPLDLSERDVALEHRQICDAAINRDAPQTDLLIKRHIERTAQIVLQNLTD